MASLDKVVKCTKAQYATLASGGTVGTETGLSANNMYLVQNSVDQAPVSGSDNLITSGGVASALTTKSPVLYEHHIRVLFDGESTTTSGRKWSRGAIFFTMTMQAPGPFANFAAFTQHIGTYWAQIQFRPATGYCWTGDVGVGMIDNCFNQSGLAFNIRMASNPETEWYVYLESGGNVTDFADYVFPIY